MGGLDQRAEGGLSIDPDQRFDGFDSNITVAIIQVAGQGWNGVSAALAQAAYGGNALFRRVLVVILTAQSRQSQHGAT